MKQGLLGAGWIVAIIVAVASWVQMGKLRDEIDETGSGAEAVGSENDQLAKLQSDYDALKGELNMTQKSVSDLEEDKKSVSDELAALQAEFEKVETKVVGEEPKTEDELKKAEDAARRKEAQKTMMEAQATAITEMTYSKMFSDLQLDVDVEAEVNGVLVERLMEQIVSNQKAMKAGDVPAHEVYAEMLAEKEASHERLREILDEETFEKIIAYDADSDRHQLEGTLSPQLNQFSSGLTPENKELVSELSIDLFDHHQREFMQSDKTFSLYENADWQITAMDDILDQLSTQLDTQQLGEVERWFNIGKKQMEALKKR